MTAISTQADLPSVDPDELRRCLGSFVTGVTVMTALDEDGNLVGMTANSFTSLSLDPPLIVWSLRLNSSSMPIYKKAHRFVVNILAQDQIDISNRFSKSAPDRFNGIPFKTGIAGVPLIDGCASYLECKLEASYPGGDHLLFVGRVERIQLSERKPLAFGGGRYMVVHPYDNKSSDGMASEHVATLNAIHLARPCLEDINRDTGKTVGLGVWGNMGPTMIWWIEARRPLELRLRFGLVVPLLGSATGKIFAAYSNSELINSLVEAEIEAGRKNNATSLTSHDEVQQHLALVRERRCATISDLIMPDIHDKGVHAVSVPVFDAAGAIVLALTMMDDATEFQDSDKAVVVLKAEALILSKRLGYRG